MVSLSQWAQQAESLVCTRKDLVKPRVPTLGGVALWAVGVEIDFLRGQKSLEKQIDSVMQGIHDVDNNV
jgi:hypothetical protein